MEWVVWCERRPERDGRTAQKGGSAIFTNNWRFLFSFAGQQKQTQQKKKKKRKKERKKEKKQAQHCELIILHNLNCFASCEEREPVLG